MDKLFIWAHRGASRQAPENTMAAFHAAQQAGADGIECDVHLTRDGIPVVIHDETVDRTTNGKGPVSGFFLRELRRLDAGSSFSSDFAGEPVPTLEEVLDWAANGLRLNVEIKTFAAGAAVLEMLSSFPKTDILISSFHHALLEKLRHAAPDLPIAFLLDSPFWRRVIPRAIACRAESFNPRCDLVSWPMVAACRHAGLAIYPWTVDDFSRIRRLRRLRVDGIFTNDPGAVSTLFRRGLIL
jgi:glycerophosphoryl diester phosphodiesterase